MSRIEVVWFVDGEPKSRGFRSNNPEVRAMDFADKVLAGGKLDAEEGVTVYLTSKDGEDTYGYYHRMVDGTIKYYELG